MQSSKKNQNPLSLIVNEKFNHVLHSFIEINETLVESGGIWLDCTPLFMTKYRISEKTICILAKIV